MAADFAEHADNAFGTYWEEQERGFYRAWLLFQTELWPLIFAGNADRAFATATPAAWALVFRTECR